ncbi:hypothetical protein [Tsukamurella pulmonis]|uniref:hypothetical protein n=1 Tax=Tsukamurella pulmonis TaxID=47312 RepID=UPI000E095671|nr:hypothetical protein [Tsukamurella pulmonis]RDH12612.1 hypothetical protein DVB88_06620 [Tsukamurella pulmonis]
MTTLYEDLSALLAAQQHAVALLSKAHNEVIALTTALSAEGMPDSVRRKAAALNACADYDEVAGWVSGTAQRLVHELLSEPLILGRHPDFLTPPG